MTGPDRTTNADVEEWGERTFYDFKGAAARAGRSLQTIYRWKDRGLIHPVEGFIQTAELIEADRITRQRGGDQTRGRESTDRILTREDAAERVGRSVRTIRDWERHRGLVVVNGMIGVSQLLEVARQMKHRVGRPRKDRRQRDETQPG